MYANKSIVVSSLYKSKTSEINIQCKMWQPPDEEEKKSCQNDKKCNEKKKEKEINHSSLKLCVLN